MYEMVMSYIIGRLNEATTWTGMLTAISVKFGLSFAPQFDTLLVNAALALVVLLSYLVKGGPVIVGKKP